MKIFALIISTITTLTLIALCAFMVARTGSTAGVADLANSRLAEACIFSVAAAFQWRR